ncbi:MAG: N-acetyl-gamma-glutamyl-phosphate reductase, partial [Bacteroidales bacterium]|nr:N-acetyl-gamma-glutamyl-phosphate reductase [Bacteroidales bacterium]
VTGSTGAGAKPGPTTHFSWRSGNISAYKIFTHQHLPEILRTLSRLCHSDLCHSERSEESPFPEIHFIPLRGDFARGIFAAVHTECPLAEAAVRRLYEDYYADAPFTFVAPGPVDLKQVTGTNKCLLQLEKHGSRLVVCSVIDNLLKGASGQAVENMNLMFGLPEDMGLHLKATAY